MDQPPRRVGKRLVGRFLFLRIAVATTALVAATVGASFLVLNVGYSLEQKRAQALNTLAFGACAVTASARFSRKSALHWRSFRGNAFAWWSYTITLALQIVVTYVPGLNSAVFSMAPMDAYQWGIVALMAVAVFLVMEVEKCLRNYLSVLQYDVDDRGPDAFWDRWEEVADDAPLPAEVGRFGRNELSR